MAGTRVLLMASAALIAAVGLPYILLRLSFVFPAAAVDEAYTLANAWAHTRGEGFRLLATVFLTALPMLAVIYTISSLLGALLLPEITANTHDAGMSPEDALRQALADNAAAFALAQLVLAALSYILMALMVSAVSIAFCACTGWVPATGAGPPATRQDDGEGTGNDGESDGGP